MKKINYNTSLIRGDFIRLIPQTIKSQNHLIEFVGDLYYKIENYDNKNSLSGVGTLIITNTQEYMERNNGVIAYYKNGFLLLGGYNGKDFGNYGDDEFFDLYKLDLHEIDELRYTKYKLKILNKMEKNNENINN